jgi:hypothetical protein
LRNAYAALLTDDPAYRKRGLASLRCLARAYPGWPVIAGRGRLGCEDAGESHFIALLAQTYDCLAAAPLAAADNRLFRALLEATRPATDAAYHPTCGNHGTAVMHGRLAAAVALQDRQGIHDALYGCRRKNEWRYGLIHQLRHDILSDGLHWERAPGYHFYTLYVIAEMADLLLPLGVDLWHAELPPQWQDDGRDLHRAYGPCLGRKNLKAAFDAPFYLAFPNGDLSMLGDSRFANLRGAHTWGLLYERAYEMYRDPKYAWLITRAEADYPLEQRALPGLPLSLQQDWITELGFARFKRARYPKGRMDWRLNARIGLCGEHRRGCSRFPVYGAAVLRAAPETTTAPAAFLFWGPHSAGHQSPAALHVDFFGDGERITDAPRMDDRGYSDPLYLTWARTTIAHNTVTVDEAPMFPYDFETESIWEADRWRDSISDGVELLFQPDGARFKAARAMNERVYPGVRLDRTVVTTPTFILDVFRVSSARRRQFDWAMHVAGTPQFPRNCRPDALGDRRGYRHFTDVRRLPGSVSHLSVSWKRAKGLTHVAAVVPQRTAIWLARDPLPAPDRMNTIGEIGTALPRHTLLLRVRGKSALFVSAWSYGAAPIPLKLIRGNAATDLTIRTGLGVQARVWRLPIAARLISCHKD